MDANTRPVAAIGRRLADSRAQLAAQAQVQRDAIAYCHDLYDGYAEGQMSLHDARSCAFAAMMRARLHRRGFVNGRECWFCGVDCYAGWPKCDTCGAPKNPPGPGHWWQFWKRDKGKGTVLHG